ncbi:MAG: hypothetical protein G01um101416_213 [Microgenomates group bacterium Gr01-1014_16]|nr:MAG: hypothetical protein G01um101416_213 [Microgenomates group bacterium Gr01-1014_16]
MSFLRHLFLPRESNNWRARLLHPSLILVIIIYVAWSQQLISKVSYHFPQILGFASQIPPETIISLTNSERASRGLAPLKLNSVLSQAAQAKAGDMFARDYWAHVSPAGAQPWTFITAAGYSYRYAAENLARDFSDPNSIVTAWIASPSHRENLFSSKYQEIGVAVVDGKLGGQETTLVVQMFGTPLANQPLVSGTSSFTVQAATAPAEILAKVEPISNPFGITKVISLAILGLILAVLVIDIVTASRQKIVRWTSKSLAHFIFLATLAIAALFIWRGQIL